jgi:hypothetical protein
MKKLISLALIIGLTTVSFGQTETVEATAKAFYQAWKTKNKVKMAALSTPKVSKLPNLKSLPDKNYEFDACNFDEDRNVWYCNWISNEMSAIGVSLQLKKVGGKFKVTNLLEGEFEAMDFDSRLLIETGKTTAVDQTTDY